MTETIKLKRAFLLDIGFCLATAIGLTLILFLFLYEKPLWLKLALMAGPFVYIGLGLPRWLGFNERKKRAEKAKLLEKERWGFYSRDRDGPWITYIDYCVVKTDSVFEGKRFYSDWLIIENGKAYVNPGSVAVNLAEKTVSYDFSKRRVYAWDGCTPKKFFYWFMLLGTPDAWQKLESIETVSNDGKSLENKQVFWQLSFHASLVHDVLYQYLDEIPLNKKQVDRLFLRMLVQSGFNPAVALVYYGFVRLLGAGGYFYKEPGVRVDSEFSLLIELPSG